MRFKVLIGAHNEGGMTYGPDEEGGDVVDSKSDLSQHNSPGAIKFARVANNGAAVLEVPPNLEEDEEGNPNFDRMTVAQLKDFAEENDIELSVDANKAEIRNLIKETWGNLGD